jgi:hypothetical protein
MPAMNMLQKTRSGTTDLLPRKPLRYPAEYTETKNPRRPTMDTKNPARGSSLM